MASTTPQSKIMPPTSSPSQYPNNHDNNQWYQQPQHTGRINDAVNSAFSNADQASYLSPEVLSQITANVIQQLKTTGLENIPGQQQQQQQPQQQPPMSPRAGREDNSSYQPYHPPPPSVYQNSPRPPSRSSHISQPMSRSASRASQISEYNTRVESRSSPLSRGSTDADGEMTTLEKIWGKLIEDGKPTKRLGQFLRGIAMHLIEDYPPGNTIVITPEKMQKFYEDTAVACDPYPWQDIFHDRTSSISRLLREVEAEHHLIQIKLNERPDVPGLTPRGFERWASVMVQAHPDKEFERLQKAVLNMPISNPDDKKERFPKEIPRRLFPETPNFELRKQLDQYLTEHCAVKLPPITDEEIAAALRPHKTYVSPAVEDEEEEDMETVPNPIERERKPYSAQPGGGKMYDESGLFRSGHGHSKSFSSSTARPRESSIPPVPGHRTPELHNQDPLYPRSGSATPHHPLRPGRSRSSSRSVAGHEYRHSEGDILTHHPYPRYAGDHYLSPTTVSGDTIDDSRRYRDFERENEDRRLYDAIREREKAKYHDHFPPRGHWVGQEDYYRALSGPSGSGGYDPYGYRGM